MIDTNLTTSLYLEEYERRNYGQNDSVRLKSTNVQLAKLDTELKVASFIPRFIPEHIPSSLKLLDGVEECLALCTRNVQLQIRDFSLTVSARKRSGTPRRSAVHLLVIGLARVCVAQRHIHHSVVNQR
ncbi:hypothetical protein METSCH_D08580 [Metschnikowia aff. pulcherrima]|uniref:Uncharacterized protein n=1 Tax=Metschnikowia aff. pulcherrima TaxID=2163413 RepID=A0A4P6XSK7_9ASCO|nr:hypothetical protein METSCH_D08580 [Metschnikowia aff. pulcherrima]